MFVLNIFLCLLFPFLLGATATSLDLSWINTDTQTPAPTFPIERGPDGITWTQVAETASGVTSYTDTGLSPSTPYFYRVRAHNAVGYSAYSNTASGTTLAQVSFTLTLTQAGTGTGTVTSSPVGITCGASCAASFTSGTVVTLTAAPAGGSLFGGWSGGGCSGSGTCLVTLSAPTTVSATFTLSPSTLAAAWAFNEGSGTTTVDNSGNGNTGTLTNGVAWTTAGKYGNALSFDGVNDYLSVPNSPSLNISGTAFTLEFWANITNVPGDEALLAKPWVANAMTFPYYQYAVELDGNGLKTLDFYFGDTAAQLRGPFSVTPALGVWVHAAFTYDGANVRQYLNGTLVGTTPQTGSIQAQGNPLLIGVDGSFGQPYKGVLDEIRIYNRALSASEITTDMNTAIGSGGPPNTATIGTLTYSVQ